MFGSRARLRRIEHCPSLLGELERLPRPWRGCSAHESDRDSRAVAAFLPVVEG
jgi:hypothetical protein